MDLSEIELGFDDGADFFKFFCVHHLLLGGGVLALLLWGSSRTATANPGKDVIFSLEEVELEESTGAGGFFHAGDFQVFVQVEVLGDFDVGEMLLVVFQQKLESVVDERDQASSRA